MKRLVLCDSEGNILATGALASEAIKDAPNDGGPTDWGYLPMEGQAVHVVEFPDDASSTEAILRLHGTHRVRTIGGMAELVGK